MSAPVELDYATAKAELMTLANGRPDYVYERVALGSSVNGSCVYFDPTTEAPSCIVGHVLAKHGVTLDDMGLGLNRSASVITLAQKGLVTLDERAASLLSLAQARQDTGDPWRAAVTLAIKITEETLS